MLRSPSIAAQIASPTENCVNGFIEYCKAKGKKNTNGSNVLEHLIDIMNEKGFYKLTMGLLNNFIARIDADINFNRDNLFTEIAVWCDQTLPDMPAKEMRDALTISGKDLQTATAEFDPSYDPTTYVKNKKAILTNQPHDLEWINIKESSRTPTGFKTVNKKKCADCWLCGYPVYVYECIPKVGTKNLYIKCGEDEHVLPPGVGNMFGLLYPDLKQTLDLALTSAAVSMSLRASHTWCNRLKDQIILIKTPMNSSSGYTVNQEAIDVLCGPDQYGEQWLKKGIRNHLGPDSMFHYMSNQKEIADFLYRYASTTSAHLQILCNELNRVALPPVAVSSSEAGNYIPFVMYRLRLVFNCCIIGYTVLFRDSTKLKKSWNKNKGGNGLAGGEGGEVLSSRELDNLFLAIIDPPPKCQNAEQLLEEDKEAISPRAARALARDQLREQSRAQAQEQKNKLQPQLRREEIARDDDECPINACDTSSESYLVELAKTCCPNIFKTKTAGSNLKNKGKKHNKTRKLKKNKYKKTKRNTKKYRKIRGGVKKTKEQIQKEMMINATDMTPAELNRLAEADIIAEERERNDNEIRRINADLERQRINSITSFPTTPMTPEDIRRQQEQDLLDNARVNSEAAKARKLTVADLGGSKRRHRKGKKAIKSKKHKKIRGGNNIGANCSDPNFSIYNTNLLKLFPYKGGELQADDIYKNLEGPQF